MRWGARPGRAVLAPETAGYLTRALEDFRNQKDPKALDENAAQRGRSWGDEVGLWLQYAGCCLVS